MTWQLSGKELEFLLTWLGLRERGGGATGEKGRRLWQRERDAYIRVIGIGGCAVNTGIHNGAMRLVEVKLGQSVQHVICGFHFLELLFWHILSETDWVTRDQDSVCGPVGSTLTQNSWEEPVVAFLPISGEVPELSDEVVNNLSRDQKLGYRSAQCTSTCHTVWSGT